MLYNFSSKKFQLATVAYMIHNVVTKEELKDLKNLFEILDKNKDGKLSYDEIISGFKELLGELKHEKEFIKNLKGIDDEKCGYLEYDKFLIAAINKENLMREEKLLMTFRLFDKDNSGSISIEELKTLLSISSKGTEKAWSEIIEQIKRLRDTEISFSSFKDLMFGLKSKKQHLDDFFKMNK
jgi:calcium-dependent protein kinase